MQQNLAGGSAYVRGIGTLTLRDLESPAVEALHAQATAGGLQLHGRFADDLWSATASILGSYVHGSVEALDRTQRAAQHFLQRPDLPAGSYDPTRTSLGGLSTYLGVDRNGPTLGLSASTNLVTTGFEVNDLGYQVRSDRMSTVCSAWLQDLTPHGGVLERRVRLLGLLDTDLAGRTLSWSGNVIADARRESHWGGLVALAAGQTVRDVAALRGGPALRRDASLGGTLSGHSDERARLWAEAELGGQLAPTESSSAAKASLELHARPRSHIELGLGPSLTFRDESVQWVAEVELPVGEPGWVVGRLRQWTTSLTLRASYAWTPRLSLQLYAEPFLSWGAYAEFRQVADAQNSDPGRRFEALAPRLEAGVYQVDRGGAPAFSFDQPDFAVAELRWNVVLRWEYLPGSTFFLIWSHARSAGAADGAGRFGDGVDRLASTPGEHVVMAKASFWYAL